MAPYAWRRQRPGCDVRGRTRRQGARGQPGPAGPGTLERLRAEDAAEIARLTHANRHLVRLHAEDVAEIARLKLGHWSLRKKILFGLGCALTGAGAVRLATHGRR